MKLLSAFFFSVLCLQGIAQNVGIGTTTPAAVNKLHVHNPGLDVSIGITNGITTDALLSGTRLRALGSDFFITNQEATGRIGIDAGGFERFSITPGGKVGIGTKLPLTRLHVTDSLSDVQLRVESPLTGSEASVFLLAGDNPFSNLRITKYAPGASGTFLGISKDNLSAISTGGNAGTLILATGDGVSPLVFGAGTGERMRITAGGKIGMGTTTPSFQNNLHVHNSDFASGIDVSIGISNSITTDANGRGARFRMNAANLDISNNELTGKMSFSTGFNQRLVITQSGNIGINNINPAYPLDIASSASIALYISQNGSGPAIKSVSLAGSPGIGLELENGAIKVSGVNRTAFQHLATGLNTINNETALPTNVANSFNDMVFATAVWEGVYVNAPLGVYFQGGVWRIFRQDLQPMPLNAKFNVLVIKQ